ncbi:MAG: AAA family ATPase [Chloroflexi bacterium]|nr:AAA family ATPase [Chloroflexota bacterium]
MPTLESIGIKGFKSIRDVEVELRDINVLIGANGSGKSNFLEVFSFLQAIHVEGAFTHISTDYLKQYVVRAGGAEKLLHFGSKVTDQMEIRICFRNSIDRYRITLLPRDSDDGFGISMEVTPSFRLWREPPLEATSPSHATQANAESISSEFAEIDADPRRLLASWRMYHFHDTSRSAPIKKTANLHDNRYLRADGSNLAAFLYLLRERHEHSYMFMRNTVRLVAPFFDDFVLEPAALNEDTIRLEWKHVGTDAYFDVSSLSDGTLRFIALATLLQQPRELRPSVILLDEPELGMHPYAITMLASMVKSASVDTQVILATQSPRLLDYFEPEDVLVADRVDGATEFTPLDSSKLAIWLEDYSIGELWEMNDIGGRPAPERLPHRR